MKVIIVVLVSLLAIDCNNILLQKPDSLVFDQIFSVLKTGEKKGDYGFDLYVQLQEKVSKGSDLGEINDHIALLKNNLQTDQSSDADFYSNEQKRVNNDIKLIEDELNQFRQQQSFLKEKLQVLNSQSIIIDQLFGSDAEAYTIRTGTQQAMLSTISDILDKVNKNLVKGSSFIQKSDLFEELKKIGKDKHADVLAEITAHLDEGKITKIMNLFTQLKTSIEESIADDQAKNQENIRLHSSLRSEIAELIPKTDTQLGQVQDQIEERVNQQKQLESRLQKIELAYQDRQDNRLVALKKTSSAQEILEANMNRLARWEEFIGDKSDKNE